MNHVKPNRVSNGLLVLFFALAAFPVAAQVKISDTGSGVKTIYFPSNVIGGTGSAYEIPAKITPSTDGGLVKGTALAVIKNPSGNPLALTATARAPAAAVGAAIGKFASKVVTPLAVGSALYDLGKELGYIFDNSSGQLVVLKDMPVLVSDSGSLFSARDGTYQVASVAGQQQCSYHYGGSVYVSATFVSGKSYAVTCRLPNGSVTSSNGFGSYMGITLYSGTVEPLPQNNSSSVDEFSTAVSAKTSWPSTSAISRTLEQAQKDYDIFLDYNPPTVTGPASTPGKTSTTTSSTGTTTTSTTTHNHTYDGATVNTSNVTVTNVTNNAGDTTTTTTTESPVKEEPTPDQCEKNPDFIGCSEFGTPQDQQLTQKSIAVQLTPVVFASSATCPPDATANFQILGRSYSPRISYAAACSAATDYVRPVLLVLAIAAAGFVFIGGLKT